MVTAALAGCFPRGRNLHGTPTDFDLQSRWAPCRVRVAEYDIRNFPVIQAPVGYLYERYTLACLEIES